MKAVVLVASTTSAAALRLHARTASNLKMCALGLGSSVFQDSDFKCEDHGMVRIRNAEYEDDQNYEHWCCAQGVDAKSITQVCGLKGLPVSNSSQGRKFVRSSSRIVIVG